MPRLLAIDPGVTGALAVYEAERWSVYDAPVVGGGKKGGKKVIDAILAAELVGRFVEPDTHVHAFLERQQAMPPELHGRRQGTGSAFQIGRNYGIWEGVLAGLGVSLTIVTPAKWRRSMITGVQSTDKKEASRIRALQLFPYLAADLKRKKDHGRAEAVLIGEYGRGTMAG